MSVPQFIYLGHEFLRFVMIFEHLLREFGK